LTKGVALISVFGIGNPLMDYVAYAGFDLIESLGAKPGTMNLITEEHRKALLDRIDKYKNIPGGSCANTIRGLAWLAQAKPMPRPLYTGAVGKDALGQEYISQMRSLGIEVRISQKERETGVSVIIVTPDFERTMFTYLGSCREYSKEDLDTSLLRQSQYLHTTGYMWDTDVQKQATSFAIAEARANRVAVSFDLADPFVVQRYRSEFVRWIPKTVDILFGNREEMALMLKADGEDEDLIREAQSLAALTIMKVGAKGCYVNDRGQIHRIEGKRVKVVDTIGAGDFFAAGFLFGMVNGKSVRQSAALANSFAAGIVSVEGCSLYRLSQQEILASIDT
jgi:sugar/nucleoside kinase (ribokinase family)